MMFTMAGELRDYMPGVLMGCQLLRVPIDKLNRAKMTNVLKTAAQHHEIIVNCEDDEFVRMTMETATRKWIEICDSMEWECRDFLVLIGGNGKICVPIRSLKEHLKVVEIDELKDNCPILVDDDWFKKLAQLESKSNKRSLSVVGWSEESLLIQQSKKHDTEPEADRLIESNESEAIAGKAAESEACSQELNATLEEFKLRSQKLLEEQRQEADEKMKALSEHYEKRIQNINQHNEFVADSIEGQARESQQMVTELQSQLRQQQQENATARQNLVQLQNQVHDFNAEKREWQVEMSKLRDMVLAQNSMLQTQVKQEPTAADLTFGTVDMDSDDDIPNHSSPLRPSRKINNLSKGLPSSLAKLGMAVFNPARESKIEYLSKFTMLVEDFNSAEDFKVIKQLVYQAFAEDRNFRIQDLSTDDKSSMEKLAKAIIKQDDGDSIDLMKTFESEQIRHGETHLNFLYRVSNLYECATNFTGQQWKEQHIHAQKIYNKIDDSLPTAARSKFRELMMGDRKQASMTVGKIRECLETVILIYGDEFKSAMGSQRHVVPMVDAIQSKSRKFPSNKKEVNCWNCGSTGHMKRFCPEKGNNRESKTSGRSESGRCFICQGIGHFAARCPNKRDGHSKWSQGTKTNQ